MSRETVKVKMARGGFMSLVVEGRVYSDDVEIDSIQWPSGGEVADKNIADMTQVQEAFVEAVEGSSMDEYIASYERCTGR
jgi:hypothetical protein